MDPDADEEKCDSIYANDECSGLFNIVDLLKEKSLDELLKEDSDNVKVCEREVQWYHGKLTRDSAEEILQRELGKFGNVDGLFLVRESSFSTSSFVLSLVSKGTYYHFQINEVKSSHYSIDEGPVIQGLDALIEAYQENIHGLPAKLTQFCKCKSPPDCYRKKGVTNLLHKAVLSENVDIVKQILANKNCPNINAKNDWGATALHDSCYYGFEEIAALLVNNGADCSCLDRSGQTPLHRCCQNNKAFLISLLVKGGKASLMDRNPRSGWIPIHQAAFKGHLECVKLLLDYHSPYLPRADDDQTPLDLAENYEHKDCVDEIGNGKLAKDKTLKEDIVYKDELCSNKQMNRNGNRTLKDYKEH